MTKESLVVFNPTKMNNEKTQSFTLSTTTTIRNATV